MTRPGMRASRLGAAVIVAGALALSGCGGGDGGGAAEAPETTGSTAATAPAAPQPTLTASQEVVDLVNRYAGSFTDAAGTNLDTAELQQRAEELHEGHDAVLERVEQVVAHPCVERLAVDQASLMDTLADLLEAAAEGRAQDAAELSQDLRSTDEAAMLRQGRACQAQVGYKGAGGA